MVLDAFLNSHPCYNDQHNCSHICLPIGLFDHVCACPDDDVTLDEERNQLIHGECVVGLPERLSKIDN